MDFDSQPIMEDDTLLVRPLVRTDYGPLCKVASDPDIWAQHPAKERATPVGFKRFFEESMSSKGAVAVIDKNTGMLIGASRFKGIDAGRGIIEIGWTFLAREYWGGKTNFALKKLMVNYALDFARTVVFYVAPSNVRSQRSLEKIGAKRVDTPNKPWEFTEKDGKVTYCLSTKIT